MSLGGAAGDLHNRRVSGAFQTTLKLAQITESFAGFMQNCNLNNNNNNCNLVCWIDDTGVKQAIDAELLSQAMRMKAN